MKVEVKLNVQAMEFWNIIVESVKQDAGEGVEICEGMVFTKQLPTTLSGVMNAQVKIVEYKEGQVYAADFSTSRSTVHSSYRITEESDGILVSYEEDETFENKMDRWNAKLMKSIYKKSRTKKLVAKLNNIEKHIKGEL